MAVGRYFGLLLPIAQADPRNLRKKRQQNMATDCLKYTVNCIPDGARSGDEVVDEVCWDPDHGGEGDAEAHALRPAGVLVVVVRHRRVRDDVVSEHAL